MNEAGARSLLSPLGDPKSFRLSILWTLVTGSSPISNRFVGFATGTTSPPVSTPASARKSVLGSTEAGSIPM